MPRKGGPGITQLGEAFWAYRFPDGVSGFLTATFVRQILGSSRYLSHPCAMCCAAALCLKSRFVLVVPALSAKEAKGKCPVVKTCKFSCAPLLHKSRLRPHLFFRGSPTCLSSTRLILQRPCGRGGGCLHRVGIKKSQDLPSPHDRAATGDASGRARGAGCGCRPECHGSPPSCMQQEVAGRSSVPSALLPRTVGASRSTNIKVPYSQYSYSIYLKLTGYHS